MTDLQKSFQHIERFALWSHPKFRPEKWKDEPYSRFKRTIQKIGSEVGRYDDSDETTTRLFHKYTLALSNSVAALALVGKFKKLPRIAYNKTAIVRKELLTHMKSIGQPLTKEKSNDSSTN